VDHITLHSYVINPHVYLYNVLAINNSSVYWYQAIRLTPKISGITHSILRFLLSVYQAIKPEFRGHREVAGISILTGPKVFCRRITITLNDICSAIKFL
jgi:hypothetical protein